jgi:polyribonucleotide nucleotidyltransferase
MDISFDNVFVASIKVIDSEVLRIVIAHDKKDALNTLNTYYEEPDLLYIIDFSSLKTRYDKAQLDKNYYLVIEIKESQTNEKYDNLVNTTNPFLAIEYIMHEESFESERVLKEKYLNAHCFILNADNIIELCSKAALEFKNPTQPPLISENINL